MLNNFVASLRSSAFMAASTLLTLTGSLLLVTACGSTEPDVPVQLTLTRVDNAPLPRFAGTTSAGRNLNVTRGTLSGSSNGAECAYTLHFEGSNGTGPAVDFAGFLDEHPCTLLNNGPKELTLALDRADVPKTPHKYRFE